MAKQNANWGNLAFVMEEVFSGHALGCTFLDDGELAVTGMLAEVSALEASRPVAGSSLAAQAGHLLFSVNAYIRAVQTGEEAYIVENWPEWEDAPVDEGQWKEMLADLNESVDGLLACLRGQSVAGLSRLALGALAHMAFHLGAVRVKYDALKHGGQAAGE